LRRRFGQGAALPLVDRRFRLQAIPAALRTRGAHCLSLRGRKPFAFDPESVKLARAVLRHSAAGAGRAHTFADDSRGRNLARSYIRISARCYLAAQSWLANFQHCHQLEPGGGADQYRDLRRVEYNLNIIPTLHNNVDRNAAIQP